MFARRLHRPFIFASGTLGEELAVEALRHSAKDYVVKQRLSRLPMVVKRAVSEAREHKLSIAVEDRLRETQRRLEAILDNASVSVFVMDEGQRCIYMNAAAEELTGFTLSEADGRILHELIHHTRPNGSHFLLHECAIDRAFPEDSRVRGEEVFVHKDGHFYPVAFTASPIRDEHSKTIGTLIQPSAREVTYRLLGDLSEPVLFPAHPRRCPLEQGARYGFRLVQLHACCRACEFGMNKHH